MTTPDLPFAAAGTLSAVRSRTEGGKTVDVQLARAATRMTQAGSPEPVLFLELTDGTRHYSAGLERMSGLVATAVFPSLDDAGVALIAEAHVSGRALEPTERQTRRPS